MRALARHITLVFGLWFALQCAAWGQGPAADAPPGAAAAAASEAELRAAVEYMVSAAK